MVNVVLPTRQEVEIRKRCVARPEPHQAILLQRLGLELPETVDIPEPVERTDFDAEMRGDVVKKTGPETPLLRRMWQKILS